MLSSTLQPAARAAVAPATAFTPPSQAAFRAFSSPAAAPTNRQVKFGFDPVVTPAVAILGVLGAVVGGVFAAVKALACCGCLLPIGLGGMLMLLSKGRGKGKAPAAPSPTIPAEA